MPATARLLKSLTQSQAADAIVIGIERDRRSVLRPRIFRALFFIDTLFPRVVARFVNGG